MLYNFLLAYTHLSHYGWIIHTIHVALVRGPASPNGKTSEMPLASMRACECERVWVHGVGHCPYAVQKYARIACTYYTKIWSAKIKCVAFSACRYSVHSADECYLCILNAHTRPTAMWSTYCEHAKFTWDERKREATINKCVRCCCCVWCIPLHLNGKRSFHSNSLNETKWKNLKKWNSMTVVGATPFHSYQKGKQEEEREREKKSKRILFFFSLSLSRLSTRIHRSVNFFEESVLFNFFFLLRGRRCICTLFYQLEFHEEYGFMSGGSFVWTKRKKKHIPI